MRPLLEHLAEAYLRARDNQLSYARHLNDVERALRATQLRLRNASETANHLWWTVHHLANADPPDLEAMRVLEGMTRAGKVYEERERHGDAVVLKGAAPEEDAKESKEIAF